MTRKLFVNLRLISAMDPKICSKTDFTVGTILSCPFSAMVLHDGLGHGKADAIAAGRLGSGDIRPIEPVKQLFRRHLRQFLHGVFEG